MSADNRGERFRKAGILSLVGALGLVFPFFALPFMLAKGLDDLSTGQFVLLLPVPATVALITTCVSWTLWDWFRDQPQDKKLRYGCLAYFLFWLLVWPAVFKYLRYMCWTLPAAKKRAERELYEKQKRDMISMIDEVIKKGEQGRR